MEFPNLGDHCSMSTCHQLDFLPVKCDACGKVFCNEHYPYVAHECPKAAQRDVQVPICPLCGIAVPVKRGEQPDIKVGEHIDNNCTSDVALSRKKVYANRCSLKGCKRKEMVPITCPDCGLNYCLTHRHGPDHNCQGRNSRGPTGLAGAAAVARASKPSSQKPGTRSEPSRLSTNPMRSGPARLGQRTAASVTSAHAIQGGMSEDEALARALQLSMTASQPNPDAFGNNVEVQISEDEALARALAASEREARGRRPGILSNGPENSSNKNCTVS